MNPISMKDALLAYQGTRTHNYALRSNLGMLAEYFGTMPLHTVRQRHILEYRQWRRTQYRGRRKNATVSDATINMDTHHALAAFLSWAINPQLGDLVPEGWVNPIKALAPLKKRMLRRVILEPGKRAEFLAMFPAPVMRIQVELLYLMGTRLHTIVPAPAGLEKRRGFRTGMYWDDLSADLSTWTFVDKTINQPERAVGERAQELLRQLGPRPSGPVFAPEHHSGALRALWMKNRKALGYPTLRPHDLRVAFATELYEAGVNVLDIQKLLGHASLRMTLHYIHLDERRQAVRMRAALNSLGKVA